nr:putative phage abortive infection protein [uncultured Pseudodesulfovibrio sp.]
MREKKQNNWLTDRKHHGKTSIMHCAFIGGAILTITFGVLFYITILYKSIFLSKYWISIPSESYNLGSLVDGVSGSLFVLASALLLFATLIKQQKNYTVQQFETQFFQMVQLHRKNVEEMVHHSPRYREEITGRRVFIEVIDQFCHAYAKIGNHPDVQDKAIPVAYLATFFGVGGMTQASLKPQLDKLTGRDSQKIIDELYEMKRVTPNSLWGNVKSWPVFLENESNNSIVYLGGHVSRLGHYFRHLYHCIRFVDKSTCINQNEKRKYIKILRAQLSNEEQICLFLNSLSPLGWDWGKPWDGVKSGTKSLIMKYGMIKNIPENALAQFKTKREVLKKESITIKIDIKPNIFYNLNYEHQKEKTKENAPDFTQLASAQSQFLLNELHPSKHKNKGRLEGLLLPTILWGGVFLFGIGIFFILLSDSKIKLLLATASASILLLLFFFLGKISTQKE